MTRHVLRPVLCSGASVLIRMWMSACMSHILTFYPWSPTGPNPSAD